MEREGASGSWARAFANISRQVALRLIGLRLLGGGGGRFFFFFFFGGRNIILFGEKRNYQQRTGEINIWKLTKCNLHIQLIPSISVERIKMRISMMDIALIGT